MIEGLKPYAEYKESGSKWLGAVPAKWEVRNLRTLISKRAERDRPDLPLLSVAREKGVFVRSMTDADENHNVIPDDLTNYKVARAGNLVINKMKAWQGSMGIAPCDGIVSPAYFVFDFRIANHAFGQRLLRSKPYVAHFAQASDGVRIGQWDLSIPGMRQIPVLVPSDDEQAAIVRFLDHANRKIDGWVRAKRKLIGLLNEQKQAIIHRAVTRGLHPDVPLKPSGIPWLGDIPKHWEVLPLGRVLVERKESNDPIKTKNILSLSLHDGVVPYAEKTRPGGNKAKDDLTAYKLAYPGDIVVNSMNVVVGSVGLSRYFGAVSPVYYMLRPRQGKDTVEYFDSIFHDVAFQRSLFGLGNGIMVIQSKSSGKLNTIRMRIPMGKLNRVEIPYPPPSEQQAIVAGIGTEIAPVTTAIARTEREIALMQEYRTRLTADLVTGKLDVREAAAKLPEPPAAAAAEPVADEPLEEIETEETE